MRGFTFGISSNMDRGKASFALFQVEDSCIVQMEDGTSSFHTTFNYLSDLEWHFLILANKLFTQPNPRLVMESIPLFEILDIAS